MLTFWHWYIGTKRYLNFHCVVYIFQQPFVYFSRLASWAEKFDSELLRLTVGEEDITKASQLAEVSISKLLFFCQLTLGNILARYNKR